MSAPESGQQKRQQPREHISPLADLAVRQHAVSLRVARHQGDFGERKREGQKSSALQQVADGVALFQQLIDRTLQALARERIDRQTLDAFDTAVFATNRHPEKDPFWNPVITI